MKKHYHYLSSDGLFFYNFFLRPEPKPRALDFDGLTENEILQKFPFADLSRKKEGSEICLEIRLSDATILCVFDKNKICKEGYLFPDN